MNALHAHLLDAVRHAPSLMNTQPWRVGWETSPPHPLSEAERGDRKSIAISGGDVPLAPVGQGEMVAGGSTPPLKSMLLRSPLSASERGLGGEVSSLWIALGCAAENVLLTLEQVGFDGACHVEDGVVIEWRARTTPPPDPRLYRMIRLRRTSRRPFGPAEPIPMEGVEWLTADQRPLVRRQMLADISDPARAREMYAWTRFTPGPHRDGLTAECLGLRPWEARVAAVLTHPFVPAWLRRLLLDDVPPSPLWGVLHATSQDADGWFTAGRRLQRLWLEAAARGVSLHPVRAALDPPACLMFRFGTSPPVPAAPRLPADELLE